MDRSPLEGGGGRGQLTDQYLPATMPGFQDARIYPLRRPDLRQAYARTWQYAKRPRAVLYTLDFPQTLVFARIRQAEPGEDRARRPNQGTATGSVLLEGVCAASPSTSSSRRGRLTTSIRSRTSTCSSRAGSLGSSNNARFNSPVYDRRLRRAASLQGEARARAYGALDVRLAREVAPMVTTGFMNEPTLVSDRVGCVVLRPELDLTAVCVN